MQENDFKFSSLKNASIYLLYNVEKQLYAMHANT